MGPDIYGFPVALRLLGSHLPALRPLLAPVGLLLAALGLLLGRPWAAPGRSWAALGRSGFPPGQSWAAPGRSWAPLGSLLAALGPLWVRSRGGVLKSPGIDPNLAKAPLLSICPNMGLVLLYLSIY